ncbi:MAG: 16S rRNA (adenine(1518)-N(6)/adenine(1519)-N(6))-dimethyltransferase RsmA [Anaerovoracaceae bacterium]|nr:16S rRNA (adenine(1518)-N(6)/adenine(1519)-N(6))-dimethyltransferase RsmA [Anaerovoracaceae bacterium]
MKLYTPSTIMEIQRKYNLRPSKSLGQNFLADQNIINGMIEKSEIKKTDLILEIGPGIGTLTEALCQSGGLVLAVEIDRKMIPILDETLKDYPNKVIIHNDILKTNIHHLIKDIRLPDGTLPTALKVVANLPYYITSPILMKILEDRIPATTLTMMMQKEVANRLTAKPGTKEYGAISLAVQYYSEASKIIHVPRDVFIPRPEVDSTVVLFKIRQDPPVTVKDEALMFALIKGGFGMRRKTLLNSLVGVADMTKDQVGLALRGAGIEEKRRGETLSLEEFAHLANKTLEVL